MKKNSQNESEVLSLINKIQEQLILLDKKVETLINRPTPKPVEVKSVSQLFQQPVNTHAQNRGRQDNGHRQRMMHKAICADCKKECEIPFRPNGDRPVYCRECFSRRKGSSSFKANTDNRPKETAPAQITNIDKPKVRENKRSAKPVSKKKKSKR